MSNTKITVDGEVVRRYKETSKKGIETTYLVVKELSVKFPNTFRLSVKDASTIKPFAVGEKVTLEAFVGGRDWTNGNGELVYFTDLRLFKIQKRGEAAAAPAAEPVDDGESPLF